MCQMTSINDLSLFRPPWKAGEVISQRRKQRLGNGGLKAQACQVPTRQCPVWPRGAGMAVVFTVALLIALTHSGPCGLLSASQGGPLTAAVPRVTWRARVGLYVGRLGSARMDDRQEAQL